MTKKRKIYYFHRYRDKLNSSYVYVYICIALSSKDNRYYKSIPSCHSLKNSYVLSILMRKIKNVRIAKIFRLVISPRSPLCENEFRIVRRSRRGSRRGTPVRRSPSLIAKDGGRIEARTIYTYLQVPNRSFDAHRSLARDRSTVRSVLSRRVSSRLFTGPWKATAPGDPGVYVIPCYSTLLAKEEESAARRWCAREQRRRRTDRPVGSIPIRNGRPLGNDVCRAPPGERERETRERSSRN